MTDRLSLQPHYLRMVEDLLHEHVPDAEVWAYGSRVNGESHEGSDLDLVVRGPDLNPLGVEFLDLVEALQESSIPILVQAHDWARLPESFHTEVERDYVVVQDGAIGQRAVLTVASGEWIEKPFSQAVQINPTARLKRGAVYPFVDMAAVNPDSRSTLSTKQREFKGSGSRFQSGDTLMARITPCLENGKIARYRAIGDKQEAHGSTEFIVVRGRSGVTDNDFAYYLTQWEKVRNYAIGQVTGTSGRQRVPVDCLDHLDIPIPPLSEQKAIAHVLGTLDDKIELNRRMNETLEAMARALFKSWFVDFEPVRAKMEGRWRRGESLPGLPAEHYDLFPDRLVDSELGEIPEGWEVKTLGDCYHLTMGQSPPGSTYNENGTGPPFFQGTTDFGERYPTNRRYCTKPSRLAQAEDTLVSVRAPVGAINRAWERSCMGRGVAALRHRSGSASYTYYAIWATQPAIGQYEHTGTVFGAIGGKQFRVLQVLEPLEDAIAAFDLVGQDLDRRIRSNVNESRSLATQRDTLLPGLVSGEVGV